MVMGGADMKTLVIWILLAGLAAAAWAQNDEVRWAAVGYVRVFGERGKLTLARFDFEDTYGEPGGTVASNLFGDQLPGGSMVYLWNRATASYDIMSKPSRGGWGQAGTTRVARGQGFWIRVPTDAASNTYPVYLMGAVPDRYTAPVTTLFGVSNLNLMGYPYPATVAWTNTDLAKKASSSSMLYLWDQSIQQYAIYSRSARSGWEAARNVVLLPGQGFWFRDTGSIDWVEIKPYFWP